MLLCLFFRHRAWAPSCMAAFRERCPASRAEDSGAYRTGFLAHHAERSHRAGRQGVERQCQAMTLSQGKRSPEWSLAETFSWHPFLTEHQSSQGSSSHKPRWQKGPHLPFSPRSGAPCQEESVVWKPPTLFQTSVTHRELTLLGTRWYVVGGEMALARIHALWALHRFPVNRRPTHVRRVGRPSDRAHISFNSRERTLREAMRVVGGWSGLPARTHHLLSTGRCTRARSPSAVGSGGAPSAGAHTSCSPSESTPGRRGLPAVSAAEPLPSPPASWSPTGPTRGEAL